MFGGMVFIRSRVRVIAIIRLGLRNRRTIFLTHGMAGGGITAEHQSKNHKSQENFHPRYVSSCEREFQVGF